jgi:hypothetical protein
LQYFAGRFLVAQFCINTVLCGPTHLFPLLTSPCYLCTLPIWSPTTKTWETTWFPLNNHLENFRNTPKHIKIKPIKVCLKLIPTLLPLNSQLDELDLNSLTNFVNQFKGPKSTEQYLHQEEVKSSHSMDFHSNSLIRDLCFPKLEVNKFDGSDPTSWVTQMEYYFSLHGITNDSIKLNGIVLYLDPE